MQKVECTIKGTTSLLMNKPKEYVNDSKVKINDPNATEDVTEKLYVTTGKIYTPATHIRGALINAGKDLKVKGKGKATYSKILASMIEVVPEAIVHKKQDFVINIIRTVNPNTKGQNMTKRPELKNWELDFTINFEEEVPQEVLKEALDRAGKYVGIGDWRPATKGIHGKFIVTKFQTC